MKKYKLDYYFLSKADFDKLERYFKKLEKQKEKEIKDFLSDIDEYLNKIKNKRKKELERKRLYSYVRSKKSSISLKYYHLFRKKYEELKNKYRLFNLITINDLDKGLGYEDVLKSNPFFNWVKHLDFDRSKYMIVIQIIIGYELLTDDGLSVYYTEYIFNPYAKKWFGNGDYKKEYEFFNDEVLPQIREDYLTDIIEVKAGGMGTSLPFDGVEFDSIDGFIDSVLIFIKDKEIEKGVYFKIKLKDE